jgi:parallel beta-helix repeat protein
LSRPSGDGWYDRAPHVRPVAGGTPLGTIRQPVPAPIRISRLLAIATLALLLIGPVPSRAGDPAPSATVGTTPSNAPTLTDQPPGTLQDLVDGAPEGGVVAVPPGLYREQVTVRRPVTIRGGGAEIRGSDVWTDWTQTDRGWRSADTVPDMFTGGECSEPRCAWPEQVFLDGVPLLQVERDPSAGQFARDSEFRILLGDDPSDQLVEVTVRQEWFLVESEDVTIEDMTMRHAGSAAQYGGIHGVEGAHRLMIHNVNLSDTSGALVSFHGVNGGSLFDSTLRRGGQLGVKGGGPGTRDLTITGNRIEGNNTEGYNDGWEAGGIKLTNAIDTVISDNEVIGNTGPGIWCDIDCSNTNITGNRVSENSRAGIMFEISDGATIADNVVWDNGWGFASWAWGAGILISSSKNAVVQDNTLAWNADGITVVSQKRDRPGGDQVHGVQVIANTIVAGAPGGFLLGWVEDWDGGTFQSDAGNVGRDNAFWMDPADTSDCQFMWQGCHAQVDSFAATPGGTGSRTLGDPDVGAALGSEGLESPVPHVVNDPPRLRSLVLPLAIAGVAVGVVLLLGVAVVLRRRSRRGSI